MNDFVFVAVEYVNDSPTNVVGAFRTMDEAVKTIEEQCKKDLEHLNQDVPEEKQQIVKVADYDEDTFYLESAVEITYKDEYYNKIRNKEKGYKNEKLEFYRYEIAPVQIGEYETNFYLNKSVQ